MNSKLLFLIATLSIFESNTALSACPNEGAFVVTRVSSTSTRLSFSVPITNPPNTIPPATISWGDGTSEPVSNNSPNVASLRFVGDHNYANGKYNASVRIPASVCGTAKTFSKKMKCGCNSWSSADITLGNSTLKKMYGQCYDRVKVEANTKASCDTACANRCGEL